MSQSNITDFEAAPFEIIDGDRGKNYPKQNELLDSGYCVFLSATNVTRSGFEFSECQFITDQKDEVLRKGKLQRDDVVLTTRGTIGNAAHFNASIPYDHMRINSGMVILRCNAEKILPTYLYHFLRTPSFHGQVNSLRSGVAQPQLPIRDMKRIKMPLPPLSRQFYIASILSAYDDLIENNRRRIQLLEQSARLLYKEWFVHLRFPGHEHTTITDGVPEGWERIHLSELLNTQYGFTETATDEPIGPKFLRGTDINKTSYIDWSTVPYCSDEKLDFKKFALQVDDIVVIRMADPGKIAIVETDQKAIFASYLVRLTRKEGIEISALYLFYTLSDDAYRGFISGASGGSTRKSASARLLVNFNILIPAPMLIEMFVGKIQPLRKQMQILLQQNARLGQARDLLLPRLMNGGVTHG